MQSWEDKNSEIDKGSIELTTNEKELPLKEKFFPSIPIKNLHMGLNKLTVKYKNGRGIIKEAALIIERSQLDYNRVAVLIGITRYPWHEDWSSAAIKRDLTDMKRVLEKHDYQVLTIENATEQQIDSVAKLLVAEQVIMFPGGKRVELKSEDDFIFYFSGHGFRTNAATPLEKGYIIPYNGDPNRPATCYDMSYLAMNMKFIPARHKLFILDSCHAGLARIAMSNKDLPKHCDEHTTEKPGTYMMLASDSGQESWVDPSFKEESSIFTRALVRALDGGAADTTGCISLERIAENVKRELQPKQHPLFFPVSPYDGGAPAFEIDQ